jgi:hypothetical protein
MIRGIDFCRARRYSFVVVYGNGLVTYPLHDHDPPAAAVEVIMLIFRYCDVKHAVRGQHHAGD